MGASSSSFELLLYSHINDLYKILYIDAKTSEQDYYKKSITRMPNICTQLEQVALEETIDIEFLNRPETRSLISISWTQSNVTSNPNNSGHNKINSSTLRPDSITKAAISAIKCLCKFPITYQFLDLMSGNCIASNIFMTCLLPKLKITKYICTDIVDYSSRIQDLSFLCKNTIDAVKDLGKTSNVLIIISPSPYNKDFSKKDKGFADVYGYLDFIEQTETNKLKFIIVIGELGRSDGTSGSYNLLETHHNLILIHYELIIEYLDIFGGLVKKEIRIYAIIK